MIKYIVGEGVHNAIEFFKLIPRPIYILHNILCVYV